jgi:5-methylcytosine-specific restriction endonuclease McrA
MGNKELIIKYRKSQKYRETKMRGYFRRKEENPIRAKAANISSRFGWGQGATDKLEAIYREAINKPCYWCRTVLTIQTLSVDHKQPLTHSKKDYYPQEIKSLNDPSNLRIICKSCNQMKSSIPEDKFQKLWDWLDEDPQLKQMIINKLKTSNLMWFRPR